MGEIVHLTINNDLTKDQKDYWWQVLENAERQAEYAKRQLGILAVEGGLEG